MPARIRWIPRVCISAVFAVAAFAQVPDQPPATPPIDGKVRLHWLLVENLDAGSLLDDVVFGAAGTYINSPKEDGPHWAGFAERTAMIAANYSVKSTMEVGLGSLWGEDPRYFRTVGWPMKRRLGYVIKETFLARDRAGNSMPAYSRYIAIPASSFLSNEWQPTSQATVNEALVRVGLGFLSRMGENAYKEFIARRH